MKINTIQLQQIIKEEAVRLKKKMMLESEKSTILKKLQEIEEDYTNEELEEELEEGFGDSIRNAASKVTGGKFADAATAEANKKAELEALWNKKYGPENAALAKKFNTDANVMKNALLNLLAKEGDVILSPYGTNPGLIWNYSTNSFERVPETTWTLAKAEQTYNNIYSQVDGFAKKFNVTNMGVLKSALIKYMVDSKAAPLLNGLSWDSKKQEIVKLASVSGGAGGVVGG